MKQPALGAGGGAWINRHGSLRSALEHLWLVSFLNNRSIDNACCVGVEDRSCASRLQKL